MVVSLKLGALALFSTAATLWHQYGVFTSTSPVDATDHPAASIFDCAALVGADSIKTTEAIQFVSKLQQQQDVDELIGLALDSESPLHKMFRSIDRTKLAELEDCASLRPGVATSVVDATGAKKSAYRSFLRSSMRCAGDAFRAGNEIFPSEPMVIDLIQLMSLDWLSSSMLTMEMARKYKPIISGLPNQANQQFQNCMHGIQSHPGNPAKSSGGAEAVEDYNQAVADLAGTQPLVKPPARQSGATEIEAGASSASRRLMKGFSGFFSGSFCTSFSAFSYSDTRRREAYCASYSGCSYCDTRRRSSYYYDSNRRRSISSDCAITTSYNDNRRRTSQSYFFFSCSGEAAAAGSCFSNSGSVWNAELDQAVTVGQVRVGDTLRTTVDRDLVWFVHKSDHAAQMVRIELADKSSIDLTPHHMISTPTGMQQASALKPGQHVLSYNANQPIEIVAVSSTKGEVSAPVTMSGTIVVNGVVASCYAFGTHDIMHATLAPFRLIHSISPELSMALQQSGLMLMSALTMVLPMHQYLDAMLFTSVMFALSIPVGAGWFTASCLKRRLMH